MMGYFIYHIYGICYAKCIEKSLVIKIGHFISERLNDENHEDAIFFLLQMSEQRSTKLLIKSKRLAWLYDNK